MIRNAIFFSALTAQIFLFGCSKPPILACGSQQDAQQVQSELENQTDSTKLMAAITNASENCAPQTQPQKKLLQDAIARWIKITPTPTQRLAYQALPNEDISLRIALLNASDNLGILSSADGKITEVGQDSVGNLTKTLAVSHADTEKLTQNHKWISNVLSASEVSGYKIYVIQSTKSSDDNPDNLLVITPNGHEYVIDVMTEMYDPKDTFPLVQVIRYGEQGQLVLMKREMETSAGGGSSSYTFYQLTTGKVIPFLNSDDNTLTANSDNSSAGMGGDSYELHFLKDTNGNVLYAVGGGSHQQGDNEDTQGCYVYRGYFAFGSDKIRKVEQLTVKNPEVCNSPVFANPAKVFSTGNDIKKLAEWNSSVQLSQLINLDRRDASDEMLLDAVKSKKPASLSGLAWASKPSSKQANDASTALTAVKQSFYKLRWVYRGTPYLPALNAGLEEPERVLTGLMADLSSVSMTPDEITDARALQKDLITLRGIANREFSATEWPLLGDVQHAYEVIDVNAPPQNNLAILLSNEPAFSGRGYFNILVKKEGMVGVKLNNGGFQVQVPEYSAATKEDVTLLRKYQNNQPRIQDLNIKVASFYEAVLNRFNQIPGSLLSGTVLPYFVVPGISQTKVYE